MPIYEYHCAACDHDFELLVPTSRDAVFCPHCRGEQVKKKFSVFGMSERGLTTIADTPAKPGKMGGGGGCCGPSGCGCR
ncbi:MAG: zinc ribbon domain-containing protein [Nitrospirae bacterium]|nr:zinc ribbon domain-containing protein [Nitrospirota bacterium]